MTLGICVASLTFATFPLAEPTALGQTARQLRAGAFDAGIGHYGLCPRPGNTTLTNTKTWLGTSVLEKKDIPQHDLNPSGYVHPLHKSANRRTGKLTC